MKQVIKKINEAKNIAIFVHQKPDSDAIGSAFAFYFLLKTLNKNSKIILEYPLIKNLQVFDNNENIIYSFNKDKYDMVCALDCGTSKLLGKFENDFKNFANSITIDHHLLRESFTNIEYIDTNVCSTAQMIFYLTKKLNIKITKDMATAIYMGIVGDTGRFLHSNTTSEVFKISSQLIKSGADINKVNEVLFRNNTLNKLKLLQITLSKMKIDKNIVTVCLTLEDYKNAKCLSNESYGLIDTLNSIENIDIAIILNEIKKDLVNISLRCNSKYDVSKIANYFGGGGHKQASGAKEIKGNIYDIQEKIIKFIKTNKKEIESV